MSTSSVKKNYIYNSIYQLLIIIIPLVTAPYISRCLGPEMIGRQSYYYSIATYFLLFIMLGVTNYGNRSIARVQDNQKLLNSTFWSIYGLQFFMAIFVILLYVIYLFFFVKKYFIIAAINGLYVVSGILDINWLFFGLEQFKITVTRNIIIRLINVLCIFIFVKNCNDLWKYSLIVVLSSVATNAYLWFYIRKFIHWTKPTFQEIFSHFKPELILFIPVIAISLYNVMDRIMLGAMSSVSELGYYTNAESVITIPMSFITSLGIVMLPRISNLNVNGHIDKSKKYIEQSIIFVVFLSSGMSFGISAIAPIFAPVFFGEEFTKCSQIIIGLSPTIILISWANVIRTQYLIPHDLDKSYVVSILSGAFINLIINYLLIPKYSAIGAVIGTVCAELVVCIMQTISVRKFLPITKYIRETYLFLFFGIIMYLIVVYFPFLFVKNKLLLLIFEIIIGIVTYFLLSFLYIIKSKNVVLIEFRNIISNKLCIFINRKE